MLGQLEQGGHSKLNVYIKQLNFVFMKKSKLIFLGIFVLIFNLIWEFSHYGLYVDLTGIPSTFHLVIASFTDLILISFIFLIISVFRKSINWIEKPKKSDYFIIVLFGIIIATIIEIYSLLNGRWAYRDLMPTILGIGISPLIQLFTTVIIGIILLNFLKRCKVISH